MSSRLENELALENIKLALGLNELALERYKATVRFSRLENYLLMERKQSKASLENDMAGLKARPLRCLLN